MECCGFCERSAPWCNLPKHCGAWETVAGRFFRWCKNGLWQKILQSFQRLADASG
ncbi:transposase [Nostoc sp. FACHB-888]|nr:transposase [Nostoc sp. FACHB-888]